VLARARTRVRRKGSRRAAERGHAGGKEKQRRGRALEEGAERKRGADARARAGSERKGRSGRLGWGKRKWAGC
jgi:hypothetical protein